MRKNQLSMWLSFVDISDIRRHVKKTAVRTYTTMYGTPAIILLPVSTYKYKGSEMVREERKRTDRSGEGQS